VLIEELSTKLSDRPIPMSRERRSLRKSSLTILEELGER
jgi:hypothetical protein